MNVRLNLASVLDGFRSLPQDIGKSSVRIHIYKLVQYNIGRASVHIKVALLQVHSLTLRQVFRMLCPRRGVRNNRRRPSALVTITDRRLVVGPLGSLGGTLAR